MKAVTDADSQEGSSARRLIFWLWVLLYGFVGSQMAWTLRPYMGEPDKPFVLFLQVGGNFYADIITSIRAMFGL
jgi:hypothetical protein